MSKLKKKKKSPISKYARFLGKQYEPDYATVLKHFALGEKNFCCCFGYFDQFRSITTVFRVKKWKAIFLTPTHKYEVPEDMSTFWALKGYGDEKQSLQLTRVNITSFNSRF